MRINNLYIRILPRNRVIIKETKWSLPSWKQPDSIIPERMTNLTQILHKSLTRVRCLQIIWFAFCVTLLSKNNRALTQKMSYDIFFLVENCERTKIKNVTASANASKWPMSAISDAFDACICFRVEHIWFLLTLRETKTTQMLRREKCEYRAYELSVHLWHFLCGNS